MSFGVDSPPENACEFCRSQGARHEGPLYGANPLLLQLGGRGAGGAEVGAEPRSPGCRETLCACWYCWLKENTVFNTETETIPKVFQRQRCKGCALSLRSQACLYSLDFNKMHIPSPAPSEGPKEGPGAEPGCPVCHAKPTQPSERPQIHPAKGKPQLMWR